MADGIDLGIAQLTDAKEIGRGGFSTVYAATDTQFDRRVAVKVLRPLAEESDRVRFERECRIMGRLSSHPAVVTVYQAGYTDKDEPFLVMELNEGGSLGDRLKAVGTIRWQQAIEYMIPIVEALQKAHEAQILHRDVKPENILLADDVPRLTDFGIAYLRDATGSASTSISASWLHTAPETFDNERDERSDIYSAASTLYDLIAGKAPFQNNTDESLNPLIRRLLDEAPPPLPAGTAPPTLDNYLAQSLAKNPDDRPQTAQEFADGLRTILESGGATAPTGPSATGANKTVTTPPPTLKPDPGPGRPQPHRPPPPADAQQHIAASASASSQTPQHSQTPQQPSAYTGAAKPGGRNSGLVFAIGAVGVLAVGGVFALVLAVARGGGDPGPDVRVAEVVETTAVPAEPTPTTETVPIEANDGLGLPLTYDTPAATLEELEARWAEGRAAVVAELSAEPYGIDDSNVLRGPGALVIDLDNCPSGWSDTAPLDGGTIPIVITTPVTGPQESLSTVTTGMAAYFDYVNANGGIGGSQVALTLEDDEFDIARTVEVVGDLDYSQVLAVTTLGSANSLAVYDGLNADCMPHLFAITAHPAFGDPVGHPFSTGLMLDWGSEAVLWGKWIEESMADRLPVTVGAIVADSEFGKAYVSSFRQWVAENPGVVSEFIEVGHDPSAVDLLAEAQELADANPDVFISMTAGASCLRSLEGAITAGLMESTTAQFHPSVCRDAAASVAPAGAGADGLMAMSGGIKGSADPVLAADPYIDFVNTQLSAARLDPDIGAYGTGFGFYGWAYVEALRIAAELPGGISRTNLILAVRGMRLVHPMLFDGIQFTQYGNSDAHFIEGSDVLVFDSESGDWADGPVVDADRATPLCPWTFTGC